MRPLKPAVFACLAVVSAAGAYSQDRATEWQPAPERLANLGPEAKVEGWSLRSPKGWAYRVKREAPETRHAWGKDGAGALIMVRPAAQPLKRTPDEVMESALGSLKARTKG